MNCCTQKLKNPGLLDSPHVAGDFSTQGGTFTWFTHIFRNVDTLREVGDVNLQCEEYMVI